MRWYLRFRLSDADVAELLAGRGVRVDPSSVYARVRECAQLYEAAARAFRRPVGERWSVDEAYVRVAGEWTDVYRAIDEEGQVIDVDVSSRRASADAAAFFRQAIEVTGVVPDGVTTDCAAADPPALSDVLPAALHETGKAVRQRLERAHRHLRGRLRPTRGLKTLAGARIVCAGHASLRTLRGGCYALAPPPAIAPGCPVPPVSRVRDTPTATPSARRSSQMPARFRATCDPRRLPPPAPPHNPTTPSTVLSRAVLMQFCDVSLVRPANGFSRRCRRSSETEMAA